MVLSSTGALALEAPPKTLLVIGAGVIGVELGSVYARLGTKVQFIEMLNQICGNLDATVHQHYLRLLKAQGLAFELGAKVVQAKLSDEWKFPLKRPARRRLIPLSVCCLRLEEGHMQQGWSG